MPAKVGIKKKMPRKRGILKILDFKLLLNNFYVYSI